jgi:hypothetical protein
VRTLANRALLWRARAREVAKPPAVWLNTRLPNRAVEWGTLRRIVPVSDHYGYDRGLPVDRFYIERFLAERSRAIRGEVLEVGSANYTRRFGSARVTRSHVVDIDARKPEVTLAADLCKAASLPAAAFDCVILTQTLQLLSDQDTALQNLWSSLRPCGALLISAPCVSRIERKTPETDFWRYTPRGLELLITRSCPHSTVTTEGRGNVLAAVAFLMGLATEDLTETELEAEDPYFPLVVCATALKRGIG